LGKIQPLESERLILREFEPTDFEWVHIYGTDPMVVRFMEWGPNSEEDTQQFIERVLNHQEEDPRRNYTLAVELKGKGPIGNTALFGISNEQNGEAELGYTFNRQFWGQGFATEAAETIVTFGFHRLGQ